MSRFWPDVHDQQQAQRATRPAYWASLIAALLLSLSSVVGVVHGLAFLAIALGIRAKKGGAAVAGLLCIGVNLVQLLYVLITRYDAFTLIGLSISLIPNLVIAALYLRSIRGLSRYHGFTSPTTSSPNLLLTKWLPVPLLIALIRFPILVSMYTIPTGAMENTVLIGDQVAVERISGWLKRAPRRGDIVVIRYPIDHTQTFIKRVVGIPTDRLRIVNKRLWVNGSEMDEPYIIHKSDYVELYRDNFPAEPDGQIYPQAEEMLDEHVSNGELIIPEGAYFVLGDNRDHSLDSRYWGFVRQDDIIGSPLFVYWSNEPPASLDPDDSDLGRIRWERIPTRIQAYDLSVP